MTVKYVHQNTNSEKLYKAFRPVWWFLIVMGQMPFIITCRGTPERPLYRLVFRKAGLLTAVYAVAFALYLTVWLLTLIGIFVFFFVDRTELVTEFYDPVSRLNVNVSLERESMRSILVPLFVLWCLMSITLSGFVTVFWKGSNYVQYFNHWNRVVLETDLDPCLGVRRYVIKENIFALIIFIFFLGHFISGFWIQDSFQVYAQFTNIIAQVFNQKTYYRLSDNQGKPWFALAFICLIYGVVGSRVQILPFLFFSMLLKNATAIWNERFRNLFKIVESGLVLKSNRQSHRRVEYASLLKDHLVLVQLFTMTANTFSLVLIVYYCANNICIICDLYYLVYVLVKPLSAQRTTRIMKWVPCDPPGGGGNGSRYDSIIGNHMDRINSTRELFTARGSQVDNNTCSSTHKGKFQDFSQTTRVLPGDNHRENENEEKVYFFFGVMTAILLYQVYVTYHVTSFASESYKQAMKGFNILRKRGFMHCKTKTEKNFIHSLVFSFARNNPMVVTGGGYFTLDRTLLLAMAANLINFVVFLYQWKPVDWGDLEYGWNPSALKD